MVTIKRYRLEEMSTIVGVGDQAILEWVERRWLSPAAPELAEFDAEDLTRARLIIDLMQNYSVNEEAIPIILHLLDQLHHLQNLLNSSK